MCQHLTVARVAEGLGVSWNTANDAVLAEGRRVLIEDTHRFDGESREVVDCVTMPPRVVVPIPPSARDALSLLDGGRLRRGNRE